MTHPSELTSISKFLSLVLRHKLQSIGLVLDIDAARMRADGHAFHRSANGVWLVEHVPPGYLKVHDIESQA